MAKRATKQEACEMRQLRSEGWKLKDIAEKYGLAIAVVGRICRYETHVYGF